MLQKQRLFDKIVDKYDDGLSLNEEEYDVIRNAIFDNLTDDTELSLAIEIFLDLFPSDGRICDRLEYIYNSRPSPGLAAACMRGLTNFCYSDYEKSFNILRDYVDFSKYYEWNGEVIYAANYFKRHADMASKADLFQLETFKTKAKLAGAVELTELLGK